MLIEYLVKMVKMVLYIAEECGIPSFHWLYTKGQMSIRMAEVRPLLIFLCFGRGTSVARRNHGGGVTVGADMMQE